MHTGELLLVCSFIIGYGWLAVSLLLYIGTDNISWMWIGSGIYGFTWLLLGLGFFFAGKEGLALINGKLINR